MPYIKCLINKQDWCITCGQRFFVSYRKNETILFLLSLKRYFCHPKQSILNKTAKSMLKEYDCKYV